MISVTEKQKTRKNFSAKGFNITSLMVSLWYSKARDWPAKNSCTYC